MKMRTNTHSNYYTKKYKSQAAKKYARSMVGPSKKRRAHAQLMKEAVKKMVQTLRIHR